MKKLIVLAILGIAGATASYGQGFVNFLNYFSSSSPTINFSATGVTPSSLEGLAVGGQFTAELSWFNGVTANPLALTALPGTLTSFSFNSTGPALNSTPDGDTADGAGWFIGPTATLIGYVSGLATFQVTVFGTEGANSYEGQSALFTMTPATGTTPVPGFNQVQVGVGSIQYNPGSYSVTNVPEPTTMVLGGLGGLALMLFRRKQV